MQKKLTKEFIIELSEAKNEPKWMLDFRLKSYAKFLELDNPKFGPLIDLDLEEILYYKNDHAKNQNNWEKVDHDVKNTGT